MYYTYFTITRLQKSVIIFYQNFLRFTALQYFLNRCQKIAVTSDIFKSTV